MLRLFQRGKCIPDLMGHFCNICKVSSATFCRRLSCPSVLPLTTAFLLITFHIFNRQNILHKFRLQLQKVAILFTPTQNTLFIYRNVVFFLARIAFWDLPYLSQFVFLYVICMVPDGNIYIYIYIYIGCFKMSSTTLKACINLFRWNAQCFELS
jgi:hypothetical protein